MHSDNRVWPDAPTGAQHHVGVNELFFSTTDAIGVIEQANSVFVRLSRFQRDQLLGAPHNIIRHPMMPGGAFKVMWDTLHAGEPFGAYVHNLAHDGSRYDVFATITPLGDGYLSVRTRPMCTEVMDLVDTLYTDAWSLEQSLRQQGMGRAAAADAGAQRLAALIGEAGIGTYNDFLMDALPREIEAREAAGEVCPERPFATGQLRAMLDAVADTHDHLSGWMTDLATLSSQVDTLKQAAEELRATSSAAAQTSRSIQSVQGLGFEFAPLMMPLQLWSDMETEIASAVDVLIAELKQASSSAARTRFRIALARLHATMIGNFTAELIDGVPGARDQAPAIGLLTAAIGEGIEVMDAQAQGHLAFSSQASQNIEQVAGLMQLPIDLLGSWLRNSQRELPDSIAGLVPQIAQQVADTNASIARLRELGGVVQQGVHAPDSQGLRHTVAHLSYTAAQLSGTLN